MKAAGYVVDKGSRLRESFTRDWEYYGQSHVEAHQEHAGKGKNFRVHPLNGPTTYNCTLRSSLLHPADYQVLDQYAVVNSAESSFGDPQSAVTPQDGEMEQDEPPSSPSPIGSLDGVDRVEEDLNRTEASRATGYMGKNSELTWMQRLRREAEQRVRMQPGVLSGALEMEPDGEHALHAVNYHLDDLDIAIPSPVQVYWMPPRHLADRLFEDYMTTVHPFFPIISGTLFRTQYRTFFESAARPGDKWMAILNIIFAIASKHARLTHAPWGGDEHDHLVYFTRARMLSMNGDTLFNHPDLQQVQVEGLTAFYLLASDQINR
jgi:hypothetical protein